MLEAPREAFSASGPSVGAMRAVVWLRASQAILFETSVVPACVGTAAAVAAGSLFNLAYFTLILVSLVAIQAGANLLKGYYEARDGTVPPASTGSWIAFDSGAAVGLARDPRSVLRVAWVCLLVGVLAGLLLVVVTQSLLLLVFGIAGFVLAWSYSSPPLKLSYRGIGELSTFLAFGPIMTVGATLAFGMRGLVESFLASLILGFLAAAISYSRYFPNEAEDRAKGKRTPVTILGPAKAISLLVVLWWAPLGITLLWYSQDPAFVSALLPLPFLLGASAYLPKAAAGRRDFSTSISLTILAHLLAGVGLVLALLS
jgi:1,4-dihydroxy-2-naphthoate octaprenyltransferase